MEKKNSVLNSLIQSMTIHSSSLVDNVDEQSVLANLLQQDSKKPQYPKASTGPLPNLNPSS